MLCDVSIFLADSGPLYRRDYKIHVTTLPTPVFKPLPVLKWWRNSSLYPSC